MDTPSERIGLLLSDDLIFTSRIVGTARDLGLTMKTARSADALAALAQGQPPSCVILDLSNPDLRISELVPRLRKDTPGLFVVAYGSHVDTSTLDAARAAGCDVVWPRSRFVAELPTALPGWFGA